MPVFLEILVILSLALIVIQDLKYRAIHIVLPILLFAIGMFQYFSKGLAVQILLWNLGFLAITLLGAYSYMALKNKKFTNPLVTAIGLGDILYFVAISPYFLTVNYMLYFVTGLLFSILCFFVIQLFKKNNLVPLAGFLALYMLLIKTVSWITEYNYFFEPPISP